MRSVIFIAAMLPMLAWADVVPSEPATVPSGACLGQPEGATCGAGGRCVKQSVSRPDFSKMPPVWRNVDVMVCVEPARSLAPQALLLLVLASWVIQLTAARRRPRTSLPPRSAF